MKEHTKIYSNSLYYDAIYGVLEKLNLIDNIFTIKIEKLDNDLFELRLFKNGYQLFNIVNTIDCLYSLLEGYQRCLFDNK